jgi:RNA polymerase sigma-70 factor (ECF subfamily)
VLRDTLSTAVEKISRFTWQGKGLFPWLRMIAINKIVDPPTATTRAGAASPRRWRARPTTRPAPGASPDALLMAEQDRRLHRSRIDQTLLALPDRYRLAIELRLIEELPREECARRLEVTLGTFDVLLFRAVRSFRKHFGDRVPEEASP